ncbi:MAG: VIT1/CCC1 transporter family protein [Elusimicrobia bacterium]|nr:VIT1/CCC1 transporter family protein [Elusimicrobiota bacterium]
MKIRRITLYLWEFPIPIKLAMPISFAITALAMLGLGAAKGAAVKTSKLASGFEVLGLGAAAAALGYMIGQAGAAIFGVPVLR